MPGFTKQRIIDATGVYQDAALASGISFERPQQRLGYPTYEEAIAALNLEFKGTNEAFSLNHSSILRLLPALRELGGLRVLAGVMTKRGTAALLPGVILPDNGSEARVGLLKSVQDQRRNSSSEASIPFTDFQQLLLAKIAAEHQPDTGKHDADNRINGAEIGHAVLVAASVDHTIVHLTVHQYIGDIAWQAGPSLLSAKVAETGATDVLTKNGLRKNQEAILPLYRVAALFIVKANQQPWPLGSDPLDLSAGFTYAAIQTQVGQPKPDLGANFDNLQLAYEYGNTSE